MQDNKLSRRAREKLRHRCEMLEAALDLFSEKGYYNVTMHEIARKAEFAIGTLYKFFKNKEDLYKAIILEKAGELHEMARKAMARHDDEEKKLREYVRIKETLFCSNVSVIRLYFFETHGESFNLQAGLDSELRQQHGETMRILASVFAAGMQKGRFRPIADPYFLAIALDGIINSLLFRWLDSPEDHPYPEDPDIILNILFKGLLNTG